MWELTVAASLLGHTEIQASPHLLCSLGASAAFRHKVCIPQELFNGTRDSPVTEMVLSSFLDGPAGTIPSGTEAQPPSSASPAVGLPALGEEMRTCPLDVPEKQHTSPCCYGNTAFKAN